MITRPTTAQLLGVVRTEIAERVAPAVTDPQVATSLQMIDHILSTLIVRADHELGWMAEEIRMIEAVGSRVAGSDLPGAPRVAEALAELLAGRSAGLHTADVTDEYNRATEVLSRAVEATSAERGELRDTVLELLATRLAHEETVIGDFQLVGRGDPRRVPARGDVSDLLDLRTRHAVVTGASRGIGAAVARELAARGARVTVVARSRAPLSALAVEIGGQAFSADLCDPGAVDGLIGRVEDVAGPVDLLVNNAGIAAVARVADQCTADVTRSFAINAVAPIELCRQVLPGMLARGRGRLVNVSSLAGITAFPTLAVYGATKAALVHFTAALQRELRGTPVRATVVQLGEVAGTDMMEQARRSPTIAAVSARLARVRALPMLTAQQVARDIADAAASGLPHMVRPRRVVAAHLIRELPSRLNDALLIGIP